MVVNGAVSTLRPPLVFGWNIVNPGSTELLRIIKLAERIGIALVSIDLNGSTEEHKFVPHCGSDLVLNYNYWSQRIVAKINNIDAAFKPYMDWTAYVGLRAVCITCEYAFKEAEGVGEVHELLANVAQNLKSFLTSPNVPTVVLSFMANDASWGYWSAIHEMTNYSPQLKVAILVDEQNHHNLERWVAEPICAVILMETAFVKNGGTVCVKEGIAPHLKFLLNYNIKVMITGEFDFNEIREACKMRSCESLEGMNFKDLNIPESGNGIGIRDAMMSIRKLQATLPSLTEADKFRESYLDMLQEPLQPVRDNLDTVTYEHFEKCTVKYTQYQKAINQWIEDFVGGELPRKKGGSKEDNKNPVIYIVGAGRGPLVDCVLRGLIANKVSEYTVYALEKNPATIYTLKHKIAKNEIEGWNKVKLIFQDMRTFKAPEAADLVVSELLGSFGDNELAPECLDGIQKGLEECHPGHNVTFIPCSYTSFAEPIYAPKVWSSINYAQVKCPFQHSYTIALSRIFKIGDKPQPCFKFEHPCKNMIAKEEENHFELSDYRQMNNAHNDRYTSMAFKARSECFIHGFAGYFECQLYKETKLSSVPGVMDDQVSWFPMFFPLVTPVYVKESQLIMIHVWRKHDVRRMWYEWALTLPHVTLVHNSNGCSHSILR
ncbi:protein arginine N-methyltransferase PRMT5 [Babesia gibsoni]|uniref:Protein arginine N-methyltransferase n=1 Tax=Babesia gibsoni TaxID=33632 RepID=A0AAD8USJ0_BABGI|nr:protein arginine N-methyltransferase PRMT5 [Babesia gibsoni]